MITDNSDDSYQMDSYDFVQFSTLDKKSSPHQVKAIRRLFFELGLKQPSKTFEKQLLRESWQHVHERIDRLESQLAMLGKQGTRQVVGKMASNEALGYLLQLRSRFHDFPDGPELMQIRAASKQEVHAMTQDAMKRLQEHNDEHGVPIPRWRFQSGLYDAEVLAHNGVDQHRPSGL